MPTIDIYDATGMVAGTECSSTGEGRHDTFEESVLTHPTHADGLVDGGDPVVVGDSVGVAFKGAAAVTDLISIDQEGKWWLSCVAVDDLGNSAIARGDRIYINRTTCVLSKISNPATQLFFGIAKGILATGTTGVVAVQVHQDPNQPQTDPTYLVVSKSGNDTYGTGTWANPLLTIGAAFDLVTATRKVVYVLDGNYDEALTWPTISGVKLIGMNREFGVILSDSGEDDQVIDVTPGVQTATFEMWIENIYIDHGNAGQDGIAFDNTAMTKKLNCYIRDCGGDAASAADRFIVTTQGDTNNAIRIYWEGNNGGVEGTIYMVAGNDGNRFYATNVVLNGGLSTSAAAVAFDIRFINCTILHEGVTGGNAAQTIIACGNFSHDGAGTFAALDTADLAGSHTETVIVP